MNAVPEPSDAIRAMRMLTTAELVTRSAALTEHGKDLFIGTVISYPDPVVRDAALAALGGAEAGQGLTEEPRPAGAEPGTRPAETPHARAAHGRKLLADLDRAEAEHRATARVPYLPLPGVVDGEVVDRLIDPDCRAGKCGSCVGRPCEHECHGGAE